ncbi:MAG: hypothetical protein J6A73_04700 [Lachnospiraceae bacterium]|nr:hypothetical protein [Lachnospiraceae bacterium]
MMLLLIFLRKKVLEMKDVDFEKLMTMIIKLKPQEMQLLAAFVSGILVKNNIPKEDYD